MVETANPLMAGVETGLLPAPCTVVIFGGAGDLSRRKLIPALYNLAVDGLLPACPVVGFAREEMDGGRFRRLAREGTDRFSRRPVEEPAWADFERALDYVSGSFDAPDAFTRLAARLAALERDLGLPGNRVYYLAVPPSLIGSCVGGLLKAGVGRGSHDSQVPRLLVGEPVGPALSPAPARHP